MLDRSRDSYLIELGEHDRSAVLESRLLFLLERLESSELLLDERSPEALEAFLARLQQKLLRHGSNALAERFGELELVAVFVTSKILDFPTIKQVKRSLLAMEPISDFFEIVFQNGRYSL